MVLGMPLLARPKENGKQELLSNHCIRVAKKTAELFLEAGFNNEDLALTTGLFHDFGKLNPYYQKFAKTKDSNAYPPKLRQHTTLSTILLRNLSKLSKQQRSKAAICISAHHSSLRNEMSNQLGLTAEAEQHIKTEMIAALPKFINELYASDPITKRFVSGGRDIEFLTDRPVKAEGDGVSTFLECIFLFSSLLQADRGSFKEWETPLFRKKFDTINLIKSGGTLTLLSSFRNEFQRYIMENNQFNDRIMVLEAPTGIGKTKIFLDILNKLSKEEEFERVFYFSPLLALTEDFERNLRKVVKNDSDVLYYTYTYKGTFEDKKKSKETGGYEHPWDFRTESFNYPLIVTTTQRLLITLFSNYSRDKLKLLSLKHSVLVVDEVQTIPRSILPATIFMLERIAERTNSKLILVSATIPEELKRFPRIRTNSSLRDRYLKKINKKIEFVNKFDLSELNRDGKKLAMFNTRKGALAHSDDAQIYLTSGIKKVDRKKRLEQICSSKALVVSTQVIEAGVDISFDYMWREIAPLDNVIQAAGRLNREANNPHSKLEVFDNGNVAVPYGDLEFKLSRDYFLENPKTDLIAIYSYLTSSYYPALYERHMENKEKSEALLNYIKSLRFNRVWEEVRANFKETGQTIIIPPANLLEKIRKEATIKRIKFGKYAEYSANFPGSISHPQYKKAFNLLDPDLRDKGILIPMNGNIDELYDDYVGLDKWIKK